MKYKWGGSRLEPLSGYFLLYPLVTSHSRNWVRCDNAHHAGCHATTYVQFRADGRRCRSARGAAYSYRLNCEPDITGGAFYTYFGALSGVHAVGKQNEIGRVGKNRGVEDSRAKPIATSGLH